MSNIIDMIKNIIGKNLIAKAIIIAGILIVVALLIVNYKGSAGAISKDKASEKVVNFINTAFLAGKGGASFKSVAEENGLYKVTFLYQEKDNEIYVTKNGKFLFLSQPVDMDKASAEQNPQTNEKTCADLAKADKPVLDVFIVSGCPFGIQMQRAAAEAIKGAPGLGENIVMRYISNKSGNSFTSMHGEEEYKENLRQICMRQENNKYWDYVSCYIKKGDSAGCLNSSGVDKSKLNVCVSDKSKGEKYIEDDFNLQTQFNVSGSPTSIYNKETISETPFGGRTADAMKTLVCCAYKNQPDFCSKTLTKESAATGFSEIYSAPAGSGSPSNGGGCQQ